MKDWAPLPARLSALWMVAFSSSSKRAAARKGVSLLMIPLSSSSSRVAACAGLPMSRTAQMSAKTHQGRPSRSRTSTGQGARPRPGQSFFARAGRAAPSTKEPPPMTRSLNLRLQERDIRALDAAAAAIAGPSGAPYVRPMTILRRALEEFNAQHEQAQQEARQ